MLRNGAEKITFLENGSQKTESEKEQELIALRKERGMSASKKVRKISAPKKAHAMGTPRKMSNSVRYPLLANSVRKMKPKITTSVSPQQEVISVPTETVTEEVVVSEEQLQWSANTDPFPLQNILYYT